MRIALIGNQNSGKTTLYNQLTGSNDHVGNFPGVTVEARQNILLRRKDVTIIDLPGGYSLSPYADQEFLIRNFLLKERPDVIINIIDATNLERNLYLTLQILEFAIPTVIAVNMMDEARANGIVIDLHGLESALGVPIAPIATGKRQGIDTLVRRTLKKLPLESTLRLTRPIFPCKMPVSMTYCVR